MRATATRKTRGSLSDEDGAVVATGAATLGLIPFQKLG